MNSKSYLLLTSLLGLILTLTSWDNPEHAFKSKDENAFKSEARLYKNLEVNEVCSDNSSTLTCVDGLILVTEESCSFELTAELLLDSICEGEIYTVTVTNISSNAISTDTLPFTIDSDFMGNNTFDLATSDGNCSGSFEMRLSLSFPPPPDLCLDAGIQTGLGGASPIGGIYSGSGVIDDGNGMTFTFDPILADTGTHFINYSLCNDTISNEITVFPLPIINFEMLDAVCVEADLQLGLGDVNPTGGIYTGSGTGVGVTDNSDGITFSFDAAAAGIGIHTVFYTYTDTLGCSNVAEEDIEVYDAPPVTFIAPVDVCINAGIQMGLGEATPIGGIYAGDGVTDDGNGMTFSFDPTLAGIGIHTLTYTFTDTFGCSNTASDDIEVFVTPSIVFIAPDDVCINAGIQNGLGGATPTGGVYSGEGVTDDGNGLTFSFDPSLAGIGTHTLAYSFNDAAGCNSSSEDFIEVLPLPTIDFIATPNMCIDAGLQTGLGGATPTGGVYSGEGVTDDGNGLTFTFDPTIAGAGLQAVSYTHLRAHETLR